MDPIIRQWRDIIDAGIEPVPGWTPLPPATPAELAATEHRLGRPLPPLLAAMLGLSRAWGWRADDEDVSWLGPDELVVGAPEGLEDAEPDDAGPGVEMEYGTPHRLTFAYSDARNFQIDDAPAAGGRAGQVVAIDPEEGRIDVVAESLEAFFAAGLAHARQGAPRDPMAAPVAAVAPAQVSPTIAAASPTLAAARAIVTPPALSREERLAELEAKFGNDPGSQALLASMRASLANGDRLLSEMMDEEDPDEAAEDAVAASVPHDPVAETALDEAARAFADAVKRADVTLGKRLRPGLKPANARSVLRVERKEQVIPAALMPLYAVFDGQKGVHPLVPCPAGLCKGLELCSLQYVCCTYASERGSRHLYGARQYEPASGVRDTFWHEAWIPVAHSHLDNDNCRATLFVDYAPAEGGVPGQLILNVVQLDKNFREIAARRVRVADSLAAWLQGLAADLNSGRLQAGPKGFVRAG